MRIRKDLTDKVFGRWTVLGEPRKNSKGKYEWKCQCSCENKTIKYVVGSSLTTGNSTSCGCFNLERTKEVNKRYNTYKLDVEYGIGYTLKGEEFYFDLEDYDIIKEYCWYLNENGYVVTNANDTIMRFHRHILKDSLNDDLEVDHKNRIKVDNKKDNLRICTHEDNLKNKDKQINNTSGEKGVYYDEERCKWVSDIGYEGSTIHLGRFDDWNEAVRVRREADLKYFGEFSYLNN